MGLEATRLIRRMLPDSEVLILSQHESPEMVRQAFKAGARGYVVKSTIAKDLPIAPDTVSRHEPFFDPAIPELATRQGYVDAEHRYRYYRDDRAEQETSSWLNRSGGVREAGCLAMLVDSQIVNRRLPQVLIDSTSSKPQGPVLSGDDAGSGVPPHP